VFLNERAIEAALPLGLVVAEIGAGDLLYFPGHWFHEVHNLTTNSKAVTNGAKWPEVP
jgi:hypothetical protein